LKKTTPLASLLGSPPLLQKEGNGKFGEPRNEASGVVS